MAKSFDGLVESSKKINWSVFDFSISGRVWLRISGNLAIK